MEIKLTLTEQELADIRIAVNEQWLNGDRVTGEEVPRLQALIDKLARASVFGHA